MLYIEQPAGVGFSTCVSTKPGDCDFDDNKSGSDNMQAVLAFYDIFPEYKQNGLYLSGESYGVIYVPYMLHYIHTHNQANINNPKVFKPNL